MYNMKYSIDKNSHEMIFNSLKFLIPKLEIVDLYMCIIYKIINENITIGIRMGVRDEIVEEHYRI